MWPSKRSVGTEQLCARAQIGKGFRTERQGGVRGGTGVGARQNRWQQVKHCVRTLSLRPRACAVSPCEAAWAWVLGSISGSR